MKELAALSWPLSTLPEAIENLARRSRFLSLDRAPRGFVAAEDGKAQGSGVAPENTDATRLGESMDSAAARLGLELEPVEVSYADADHFSRSCAPALLHIPGSGEPRFLAVFKGGRRRALVLGPDRRIHRVRPEAISGVIRKEVEKPLIPEVDQILEEAGVARNRRARARSAILRKRLSQVNIGGCWILRPGAGAGFIRQAGSAGLFSRMAVLAASYVAMYVLWIVSWRLVGGGALEGRMDRGWLMAWALLLLTIVPARILTAWLQGLISIEAGAILRQRLLHRAQQFDFEEIRNQGAGQLLGRVFESEAMETFALRGGFLGLFAAVEIAIASVVLALGAGGAWLPLLLAGWVSATLIIALRYYRRRRRWTGLRFAMTSDMIEKLVGYRTRLAQEPKERRHDDEDRELERYIELSAKMDRGGAMLAAVVPRGWLVLSVAGLGAVFAASPVSPPAMAIALAGIILAFRSLQKLAAGLTQIAAAAIAWHEVAPFFRGAGEAGGDDRAIGQAMGRSGRELDDPAPLLDARDLVFRYRDGGRPALAGLNLEVWHGDLVLIEGPSGGGKSTLCSILAGLRRPESGLLLLRGFDRRSLGALGWRRRVTLAPQFHENYVLTGTLAFNLLMGRDWPPQPRDLEEAEAVCRDLGLGDLLDRMPSGILQVVGEGGWRLSHGEKSRLFIARALLQRPDVLILDESFAALDPESLSRALDCALDRAPTLIIVAHL